jgi:hypothetical protein
MLYEILMECAAYALDLWLLRRCPSIVKVLWDMTSCGLLNIIHVFPPVELAASILSSTSKLNMEAAWSSERALSGCRPTKKVKFAPYMP